MFAAATLAALVVSTLVGRADQSGALPGCRVSSFTPRVATFFGSGETMRAELDKSDLKLNDRRVYMVVRETKDGATVTLVERGRKDGTHIYRWSGASASDFRTTIDGMLFANAGRRCVGSMAIEILKVAFGEQLRHQDGLDPGPKSTPSVRDLLPSGNEYGRVTVYWLC
jgi:hypothetical protein